MIQAALISLVAIGAMFLYGQISKEPIQPDSEVDIDNCLYHFTYYHPISGEWEVIDVYGDVIHIENIHTGKQTTVIAECLMKYYTRKVIG